MLKKIFCLILATFVFALPLTVSAEGEMSPKYYVNLSVTVDGEVPTSGDFTVDISIQTVNDSDGDYGEDEDENENETQTDSVVLNSGNNYLNQYEFTPILGQVYTFDIKSSDQNINADIRTYYLKIIDNEGAFDLYLYYLGEDGEVPADDSVEDGATYCNAKFDFIAVPLATEIIAKAVDGKKIAKEYDGKTDATVTDDCYELVGVAEGDDVKLEIASAKFNSANVKNANAVVLNELKLIGEDASKYKLTTEKLQLDGEITPRTITVTANKIVMTYGDNEPTLTYKVTGEFVGEDKLIGQLARTPGNEVGTYVITMGTLTLSGNIENYNIVFNEGAFTISNYSINTVTDSTSNVSVKGYFNGSSSITVSPISATDSNYKPLFDNAAWGKVVSAYKVTLNADAFDGDITVSFPVPNEYKGKEIAIYQIMSNGAVTCLKTIASDTVSITTSECTEFMLVTEKGGLEDDESNEKRSPIATVLIVLLIILGVIVGLILIIVMLFFGMVFFNKTEELKSIIRGIKKLFHK